MIKLEYLSVDISNINISIKAQLQPNYTATKFRILFAVFSENNIQYSLSKHFNQIGGLLAWWKRKFNIFEELDTLYGKTPNVAMFDRKFREKCLIANRNGKFLVFNAVNNRKVVNGMNLMRVLSEEIKVCCGLCAGRECRHIY
mmetsp:Transcript_45076/g.45655  ORF Transcript_45076/g.45655 Transcript_45076/m.45655 type:complete len:143 (+) Transcript_45076:412-840(+)